MKGLDEIYLDDLLALEIVLPHRWWEFTINTLTEGTAIDVHGMGWRTAAGTDLNPAAGQNYENRIAIYNSLYWAAAGSQGEDNSSYGPIDPTASYTFGYCFNTAVFVGQLRLKLSKLYHTGVPSSITVRYSDDAVNWTVTGTYTALTWDTISVIDGNNGAVDVWQLVLPL